MATTPEQIIDSLLVMVDELCVELYGYDRETADKFTAQQQEIDLQYQSMKQ